MKLPQFFIRWLRRSLENPNVSLQDPEAWNDIFGGGKAASGITINRETALTYAAVWRAVNLISDYIATLPLDIFERGDDSPVKATKHPAFQLLARRPNDSMTPSVMRQTMQAHVLLNGNAYAFIERNTIGQAKALWPLSPEVTFALRVNSVLWYTTTIDKEQRKIPAADILHIKGLSFDGLTGYSVLDKARDSMGLGLGAAQYASRFFGNNSEPRVIVELPPGQKMTPEAQKEFLRQWEAMHGGLDNSHKTAILTGGATVKGFSLSAKDSQLIESRQFEIREVANWFGLPPHKLGDTTRTAYASLEQENKAFLQDCLNPWLIKWEEECFAKLLTQRERDSDKYYFEFNRNALEQASVVEQTEAIVMEVNNGLLTLDEARKIKNRPAAPDGLGAKHRMPVNIGIMGEMPTEPAAPLPLPDEPDNERNRAARRVVVFDACRRAVKRLAIHAIRAAEHPSKFLAWLDGFRSEHEAVVADMLRPVVGLVNPQSAPGEIVEEARRVTAELFASIHADLLRTSGQCGAKALLATVAARMTAHETYGPAALSDVIWNHDTMRGGDHADN